VFAGDLQQWHDQCLTHRINTRASLRDKRVTKETQGYFGSLKQTAASMYSSAFYFCPNALLESERS